MVPVKTPVTRNGTERPHEPLLQLNIGIEQTVYRIGGKQRSGVARHHGADVEIPPSVCLMSNLKEDSVWRVV